MLPDPLEALIFVVSGSGYAAPKTSLFYIVNRVGISVFSLLCHSVKI